MLVIRKVQLDVLSREGRARFESELVTYFTGLYPRETRQAGGVEQMRKLVERGIARAFQLGFESRKQVTLFVSLLLMLGTDFDSDPQTPWARKISDGTIRNPTLRIDAVFHEAVDHLKATAGQDCEFVVRALLRIRSYDFGTAPQSTGEQFVNDVLELLREFCPQKYAHQGEAVNRELIALGREAAARYGITAPRGVLLVVVLMFMMGSGFHHDPLYPWAGKTLNDRRIPDEDGRIDLLYRQAIEHVGESLQPD
jgi:hypothetical protein